MSAHTRLISSFQETPPTGGLLVRITSADAPQFAWYVLHSHTNGTWASTSGGNTFREFMVAVTTSFKNTYVALNQASWTITASGYNAAGIWTDSGSSVTGDSTFQSVTSAVQLLGLPLVETVGLVYTP